MSAPSELGLVVNLLKQATSLRVVGEFLKSKDLPHSAGSWDGLTTDRIQPALDSGKLTIEGLYDFLAEVEEFGRCHVFLFKCGVAEAKELLKRDAIERVAKSRNLFHLIATPDRTGMPAHPTITNFRIEEEEGGSLSVKIVEKRRYQEVVSEKTEGTRRIVEYETMESRAVNVIRLSSLGILEVRIQSHASSYNFSYLEDIDRLWAGDLLDFFPRDSFRPLSLARLKTKLWKNRTEMVDKIRFGLARVRNDAGYTMVAATPKVESDLVSSEGSVNAIEEFLAAGGHQESSNIFWKEQPDGVPSSDIHVLLSGERNELALTANCTKADYEYVLAEFTRIGL